MGNDLDRSKYTARVIKQVNSLYEAYDDIALGQPGSLYELSAIDSSIGRVLSCYFPRWLNRLNQLLIPDRLSINIVTAAHLVYF